MSPRRECRVRAARGSATAWWVGLQLVALAASAQLTAFTDPVAFHAAIPGGAQIQTVDFEDIAAGTRIANGDSRDGITFHHSIAGGAIDLAVEDGLPTTSGVRFLGLDAAPVADRQIQHGDELDMVLPASHAFGMTVVTGDPLLADDILLVTPQGTAGNSPAPLATTSDGGFVYFIGLVAAQPFDTVQVRYGDPAHTVAFLYTVDDLILGKAAIAEIPALGHLGLALLALGLVVTALIFLDRR